MSPSSITPSAIVASSRYPMPATTRARPAATSTWVRTTSTSSASESAANSPVLPPQTTTPAPASVRKRALRATPSRSTAPSAKGVTVTTLTSASRARTASACASGAGRPISPILYSPSVKALQVTGEWAPRDGYRPAPEEERTRIARSGSMVWREPEFSVRELPEPEPGPGEVLIRVRACGICGSDVHVYERDADGYMRYPGMIGLPVVTGHELAGEVVAVGAGVRDPRPGDPVCAEEIAWCGACVACRSGRLNSCERLGELGFTLDGAHAELV